MPVKVDFSERIRTLREANNMTQQELGRKLGVTKAVISSYETGLHQPKHEMLFHLSRLFGVTLDYLYSDVDLEEEKGQKISLAGLNQDGIEQVVSLVRLLRSKNRVFDDSCDVIRLCLDKNNPDYGKALDRLNTYRQKN